MLEDIRRFPDGFLGPVVRNFKIPGQELNGYERYLPFSSLRIGYDGTQFRDQFARMHWFNGYVPSGVVRESRGDIFHYANFGAFESIISTGELWATQYNQLNDWSELRYTLELFRVRFVDSRFYKEQNDIAKDFLRKIVARKVPDVFVASLSCDGNILSQWRAYAGVGGVSIGFPIEIFERACVHSSHVSVGAVIYDRHTQISRIDSLVKQFCLSLRGLKQASDEYEKFVDSALEQLHVLSPFMKNPSFREEREVRLVLRPGLFLEEHRERNGRNIKYIRFPYRRFFRRSLEIDLDFGYIFTAPSANPRAMLDRAEDILSKYQRKFIAVVDSAIPVIL